LLPPDPALLGPGPLFPAGTVCRASVRGTDPGTRDQPRGEIIFLRRAFILCDRNAMSGY
jgi:hypothetical protein